MTYWIEEGILGTCSLTEITPKGVIILDVRDLKDGWNDPILIRIKVNTVFKCINTGHPVIIRCQAGIGRSNAIAISTLCKLNGKSWDENEKLVKEKVRRTQICSDLRKCCKKAVKQVLR